MNKLLQTEAVEYFMKAVLSLNDVEEAYRFFEDVCTVNELTAISQRLEVARMLQEGKTYMEIGEKTGASTATVSRVNRSMINGEGGYALAFERVDAPKEV